MPPKVFAIIIATVLLAGAVTAWAISALPSTTAVSMVLVGLIGLRLFLRRWSS